MVYACKKLQNPPIIDASYVAIRIRPTSVSFFVGVAVDGRGLYGVLELWPINISISVSKAGIWLLSSSISD